MPFLPGFRHHRAPVPATTLAFIASTSSADSTTIDCPADVQEGDLLVIVVKAIAQVTPSGWTKITALAAGSAFCFFWKIADGTEDSDTLTVASATLNARAAMFQLRADVPILSLNTRAGGAVSIATASNPSQQTLNASVAVAPVAGVTMFSSTGAISPRTTSITPDEEVEAATNFYAQLYIQESAPADYTWDMDDEGSENTLMGIYFHNMLG